ncbi:MAG: hypothetical protein PVSMB7_04830 [Chloroflexota bacterium]
MTSSALGVRLVQVMRRGFPATVMLALCSIPSQAVAPAVQAGRDRGGAASPPVNARALLHNSWDTAYRRPFGAVPAGTPVALRLRTAVNGASSVTLYVHISDPSGRLVETSHRDLKRTAGKGYDFWMTSVTPTRIGVYTYAFQVRRGGSTVWYEATTGRDGGVGQAYRGKKEPDSAFRITTYQAGFTAPSWASTAVIYQIFPDRFYNGDPSNDRSVMDPQYDGVHPVIHSQWNDAPLGGSDFFGGDLKGIIDKLPYLKALGVNTLYLNPVFLAPSNHKYDTSDYFQVDPHFGTNQTLLDLFRLAHDAGMHVILDGVFNHTGSDSVYFNRYSHFSGAGAFQSRQSPYFPWFTFQSWPSIYSTFGGFDSLPQLQENDQVKDFIFRTPDSVAQHWLERGASGWRLDAAQLKSNAWWQQFRAALKAKFPDDILIAEDTAGPIDPTPFILGNEFDGFMNYNFRDAVLSFFSHGRVGGGGSTARSFVNNLMAMVQDYPRPAILSSMNLVDSHDTERVLYDVAGNTNELKLIAAFQLTWLGAPTIYYGDEAGQTGATDPDDRRTFPWDHQDTNLETYYRKLIAIRHNTPALQDGDVSPLLADNPHRVVAFLRTGWKEHAVTILNDGTAARTVRLSVPTIANGTRLTDVMSGMAHGVSAGTISLHVPGHGIAILVQASASGSSALNRTTRPLER